jgi:transposase-like protein
MSREDKTAARPDHQGRAAIAATLGVSSDLLAHWMRRHPDGMPEPDAEVEHAAAEVLR